MGLEAANAVDHVVTGLLQFLGPVQVALLVEARLEFDQAGHLLAVLGRLDQRAHERRIVAEPVHGHLDRGGAGVVRGIPDEPLDRRVEAFVGVMHQHVAGPDGRENIGVGVDRERWQRRPRWITQLGDGKRGNLEQAGVVEHVRQFIDVAVAQLEACRKTVANLAAGALGKLEPHDGLEATLPHLLLDQLADAVVVVFFDCDVGVARDPEQRRGLDLDAGEQARGVCTHQFLQRDETTLALLDPGPDRQPLRQRGGHLDAHQDPVRVVGLPEHEAPGRRQVGHERERVRRIEAERDQRGRDVAVEVFARLVPLLVRKPVPRRELNSMAHEAAAQVLEALGAAQQHGKQRMAQPQDVRVELFDDGQVAAGVGARAHGPDALHEELVEIGGEDGQELESLEQRHPFVERFGEHAAIEFEPGQVAVEPGVLQHACAQLRVHIDRNSPGCLPCPANRSGRRQRI